MFNLLSPVATIASKVLKTFTLHKESVSAVSNFVSVEGGFYLGLFSPSTKAFLQCLSANKKYVTNYFVFSALMTLGGKYTV